MRELYHNSGRHLTGVYRFLGEGRAWDLNLVRSFADYSPRVLRAAVREMYDGYIFISPKDRNTNRLYAALGAPVEIHRACSRHQRSHSDWKRFSVSASRKAAAVA